MPCKGLRPSWWQAAPPPSQECSCIIRLHLWAAAVWACCHLLPHTMAVGPPPQCLLPPMHSILRPRCRGLCACRLSPASRSPVGPGRLEEAGAPIRSCWEARQLERLGHAKEACSRLRTTFCSCVTPIEHCSGL